MSDYTQLERPRAYIGRSDQIQLLRTVAGQVAGEPGARALYFESQGGLGKTRLLEDSPALIRQHYPGFRASDVIDLYDYASRKIPLLQHRLVHGLRLRAHAQPDGLPDAVIDRMFRSYFAEYERYARDWLPNFEHRLTHAFVRCWNRLALEHPLVMRFDTVEKLFSQKPPREALIGDEDRVASAHYLLEWLAFVLPQLKHTLLIFSGRPVANNPLVELLKTGDALAAEVQVLLPLTDPADIREYLSTTDGPLDDDTLRRVLALTEGQPLLLACYAERVPAPGSSRNRIEFEDTLLDTILNPLAQPDLPGRTLAYCLYLLAYARRGIRRAELRALFARFNIACDDAMIRRLSSFALIKTIRARRPEVRVADTPDSDDDLLLLHDEIYQLIDDSGRPDALGLRAETLAFLCEHSRRQVWAVGGQEAARLATMSDHLYYELTADLGRGYRIYTEYIDYLLSTRDIRDVLILADAFWSTLMTRAVRGGKEVYPYLDELAQATTVSSRMILRDEQVRQVKLLRARDELAAAEHLAQRLFEQFAAEGLVPPDWQHAPAPSQVPHYRHPYLMVDLGLAWATTIVQVRPQDGDQVEGLLERLIALLTAPESHNERLKPQSQLFLFRVYSLRGHLRTRQQRFAEAIDDFVLARDAFRVYAARTAEREVLPSGWYNHEIAHMFNNQAYTQARAGDLVGALASSRKVLAQYVTGVSSYYRALFYNTFALIAIMDDQLVEARDALDKARRAAADSEVQRAIGLVKLAEATLARKEMNRDGHVNPEIEEYYEAAALLLKSEPSRVCEVYDDHARFARDIAFLYAQRGEHEMVLAYRRRALELLDAAVAQLPPTPSLQLADLLETRVTVLNNLGEYDQAAKVLSYAESLMYVHMPQYSQVLAGKFALQHAIIAQRGRQEYSEALRWCAVALARAMVFAPQHHDLRAFETIVRRLLRDTPPEEVTRHWQVLGEEQLYVSAGELRYQRPSPNAWSRAWERAVNLLRVLVDEVRPLERQS